MTRAAASCVWLLLGLLVLAAAWLAPLERLIPGPFSAHMTMHMAVVAVAAPALALGVAATRHDPVSRFPSLFPPILASIAELLVVWSWHTPALHQLARHSHAAFMLEQGSFLLSGLWLWLAALGARQGPRHRTGAGIVALLLTSMHMTLLGALLALPPRALFAAHHHHTGHGALPRLSPIEDQHLGGAIMLVLGGASYLLGGLGLAARLLRARQSKLTAEGAR